MPRSERSKEASIIEFFRTAELTIAVLVMSLAKEALKERTDKSHEAKQRAAEIKAKTEKEAKRVAAAKEAAKVAAPAKVKKSHKKKPAATRAAATTPLEVEDADLDGDGYPAEQI